MPKGIYQRKPGKKSNRPKRWLKQCDKCHVFIGEKHQCRDLEPFLDRLNAKCEWQNECLVWTGYVPADGYPRIHYPPFKGPIKASRANWIYQNGPIPEDMFVCHSCDNTRCVRITHLWLGTPKDNVRDMIAKGRQNMGGLKRGH